MDKTKVLYVTNSSSLYGDNKALLNIIDGVTSKGIIPYVILGSEGIMSDELKRRKVLYRVIKQYFSFYPSLNSIRDLILYIPRLLRMFVFNVLAVIKLSKIVDVFHPEIIHTNVGPVQIGFIVAKIKKIRHVWHIREYQDLYFNKFIFPSKKIFLSRLRSNENFSIAITEGIKNYYKLSKNAKVIYDGVIKNERTLFNPIKNNFFLFVGRVEEAKGVEKLVKAFAEFCISNSDIELYIAGEGNQKYLSTLYRSIDELNISNRVKFLGYRNDIYDLMSNAMSLIVPSRFEGFGFITVEAMYSGCLVIGNNTTGTKEIIEKENLGVLYSGHDELVSAMKQILDDGIEYYFSMIKRAQKRAVELYTQEISATNVYNYYKEILNK